MTGGGWSIYLGNCCIWPISRYVPYEVNNKTLYYNSLSCCYPCCWSAYSYTDVCPWTIAQWKAWWLCCWWVIIRLPGSCLYCSPLRTISVRVKPYSKKTSYMCSDTPIAGADCTTNLASPEIWLRRRCRYPDSSSYLYYDCGYKYYRTGDVTDNVWHNFVLSGGVFMSIELLANADVPERSIDIRVIWGHLLA